MKVVDLISTAAEHLAGKGYENPRLEVELLLGHVLGMKRLDLYLHYDRPVTGEELETFRALYRRRLAREPIQYIIGSTGFRDIEVITDRRALVPRPETELLVGEAVKYLTGRFEPLVADIGAGTGVIAVSVLCELPGSRAVAVDISEEALMLARINAQRAGVEDRIELVVADMLDGLAGRGPFDAVLSNPPYISTDDIAELEPEIRDYEPSVALDGGSEGVHYLTLLAAEAHRHLKPDGILLMECGRDQAESVAAACEKTGRYRDVVVIKDLAGNDRMVKAFPTV